MVALLPADPPLLALGTDGAIPSDQMHLTVQFLGEDVTGWTDSTQAMLVLAVQQLATTMTGPVQARVMGHATFNPDHGPNGDRDPCAVYLVGDSDQLAPLHQAVEKACRAVLGEDHPAQHAPYLPHITAGTGLTAADLTYTGPIVFDRLVVALAGDWTEIPLAAPDTESAISAQTVITERGPVVADRPLATITGTMLVPGVSRNRRLYTPELIEKAVARMRSQIADPNGLPIVMRTHHGAGDDSRLIVGRITDVSVGEGGAARYSADLYDTGPGRDIATLATSERPALRSTSIHGYWLGPIQHVTHNGRPAETAADLEINAIDFTHAPGVAGAVLDLTPSRPQESASLERTPISETYDAEVTVPDSAVTELGAPALKSGKAAAPPTKASRYADPGYQDDKAQRYALDTKAQVKAAWSYISMPRNAKNYTAKQLSRIKGRIKAAAKKFGIEISSDENWMIDRGELTEATLAEMYHDAMALSPGSFCVTLCNGPVTVMVSSYQVDPADLDVVGRAAMDGACQALAALDPDWDADIDLDSPPPTREPGPDESPDAPEESSAAAAAETTEITPIQPGGGSTSNQEVPTVSEATTQAANPTAATETTTPPTRTLTDADIAALGAVFAAALKEAAPAPQAVETPAPAAETAPAADPGQALKEALVPAITEATAGLQKTILAEVTKLVEAGDEGVLTAIREELLRVGLKPTRRGYRVHEQAGDDPTPEDLYSNRADILLGDFGKTPVPHAGTGTAPAPTSPTPAPVPATAG